VSLVETAFVELTGTYVPLITTFDESGRVDLAGLGPVIEAGLASGITGFVACGTTGEGYALSLEERRAVTAQIKEIVSGRSPVLGGVGGMSTDQALDHALLAKALDLDGLMVAAPAYCLPTQAELAQHVRAVVSAAGLPTVLYDYPQRTGVSFTTEALDELAEDPAIIGIKEASGDLERIGLLLERYAGAMDVICGADAAAPVFFDAGVRCWIGGVANALPRAHVAMLDPEQRAVVHAAVVPLLEFIEEGDYIAKIKAVMGMRGLAVGIPRAPLTPLATDELDQLSALLDGAGEWAPPLEATS
jgi:4-hydroxy-tetrahydrodipicolinate synthase